MKRIINSVGIVIISTLAGCSTVQNNELYQDWQKQAYSVYKMPVPQAPISQIPVAYDPAETPNNWVYLPEYGKVSQPKVALPYLTDAEQHYIASNYGL